MLTEVAPDTWAYVQRDGSWGWSNSGLVVGGEKSLLVDTLFDAPLTRRLLVEAAAVSPAAARIDYVVNTHANGDHWFGNCVVEGAEIITSRACAAEMPEIGPADVAGSVTAARAGKMSPAMNEFVLATFGPFDFAGTPVVEPTLTFNGELDLRLGDRAVRVIELGPAHTSSDVVVFVPDVSVLFTGDLIFHGGHPVVWSNVRGWTEALRRLEELDPAVVVPGHGGIGKGTGVITAQIDYFDWLLAEATPLLETGVPPLEIARGLAGGRYAEWGERERLVVNVEAIARDLGLEVDGRKSTSRMARLWKELADSDV